MFACLHHLIVLVDGTVELVEMELFEVEAVPDDLDTDAGRCVTAIADRRDEPVVVAAGR